MNSKTSLFNLSLIRTSIRNLWAYPVFACIILLFEVLGAADRYVNVAHFDHIRFINQFPFSLLFSIASGIGIAVYMFQYLNKTNTVSFMHGLPFSRKTLFFSNLMSGTVLILIPPVIMTVIMGLFAAFSGPQQFYSYMPHLILLFLAAYVIYSLLAFSISAFTMTCCGNLIVSILFSATIIFLPAGLLAYFEFVAQENLYGYETSDFLYNILQTIYVFPENLFPVKFLIYIAATVVFLVAAYFVYKIRPLENSGEVVAFRKLRILFILAVGLVCGMVSYLLFFAVVNGRSLLFMLPLGLLGIIIANMFARKTLGLRGSMGYIIIFVIAVIFGVSVFQWDITGFEKRVPDPYDVEYVYVNTTGRSSYYHSRYTDKGEANPVSVPDYFVRDPESIKKVTELHASLTDEIENSPHADRLFNNYRRTSFIYKMKNGTTVRRTYRYVSYDNYRNYMLPMLDIHEIKSREYPLIDNIDKEILSISVGDDRHNKTKLYTEDDEQTKRIVAALKKDILTNTVFELSTNSSIYVSIDFVVPMTYEDGTVPLSKSEKEDISFGQTIRIGENFTETISVLRDMGFEFEGDEMLEKIEKLNIFMINDYREMMGDAPIAEAAEYYDTYVTKEEIEKLPQIVVKDKADIRKFYELTTFGYFDVYSEFKTHDLLSLRLEFVDSTGKSIMSAGYEIPASKLDPTLMHYFTR